MTFAIAGSGYNGLIILPLEKTMSDKATLSIDGKNYEFDVITGTENEKCIDTQNLRAQTGYITMDPGFGNTGSCYSSITYVDGANGILRYRGYPIEELAEKAIFIETAYLILYGELPNKEQLYNPFLKESRSTPRSIPTLSTTFPASQNQLLPWRFFRPC